MSTMHPFTTTTFELPGYRVTRTLGVVRGIVVRSRSVVGNLGASIQSLFGGNITIYTELCEQARDEALKQLGAPEAYKLDQWRWGYKELAGAVKQDELQIVFQFAFVPKDSQDLLQHPPQIVEVSGEAN